MTPAGVRCCYRTADEARKAETLHTKEHQLPQPHDEWVRPAPATTEIKVHAELTIKLVADLGVSQSELEAFVKAHQEDLARDLVAYLRLRAGQYSAFINDNDEIYADDLLSAEVFD